MIKRVPWTQEAENGLKNALDGYAELYKNEVNTGRAALYKSGNSWLILRNEIDVLTQEKILVVCCYEGEEVNTFAAWMINQAASEGFKVIRFHTKHRALVKMMQAHGFGINEYVCTLRV